jgi:hypothetical protein
MRDTQRVRNSRSGPHSGPTSGESDDARLRELLAVEHRLQDLVRAAKDDAGRRIAAARAAAEHRLTAAREAAESADAERARAERLIHEEALMTIDTRHRATLAAFANIPDSRIDELARLALAHAIAGTGGSS